MKLNKLLLPVVTALVLIFVAIPNDADAYKFNNRTLSHRTDAWYWIDSDFSNMKMHTEVKYGILAWNNLSEIEFTKEASLPGAGDVMIEYWNAYSGDTYATSNGNGHIVVYKKWKEDLETYTLRKETIVHEVGHEAGLAHTQESNNNISVMRQYGFNNKAYPLSDDKAGISAKY